MFETPEEIAELQRSVDASARTAGPHLASIITDETRADAEQICEWMQGMCLLTVATVTADGRPLAAPWDGYLLHGSLWMSSSTDSVRVGHLRRRPAVSATYLPGEDFALSVHGTAELVPFQSDRAAVLRQAMIDHYVPIQGDGFADWVAGLEDTVAVRIVADKVFGFRLPA